MSATNSWVTHSFEVTGPATIDATLSWNSGANLNLFLYDPTGVVVKYSASTTAKPETVHYEANAPGTWKLAIKDKNSAAAYDLKLVITTAAPAAPAFPGEAPAGQIVWGAGINGNGDPMARHEAPAHHALGVRRTFYQWSQRTGSLVTTARDDLVHHRLPWVSTKTPSWAAMANGSYDGEIDQMLTALGALPGPVWLTIHHEPEGGGGVNAPDDPAGPSGHIAMNRRVRARLTALGVHNVALAPIFMSWTWDPASKRNIEQWWAPGIYDFLGVDHYEDKEASLLTPVWSGIRSWAAGKSVEVAVGEWGVRGTDAAAGQRVREWFDAAAGSNTDGRGASVVGLSAFDSNLNSPSGGWELKGEQLTTFQALLNDPRNADVSAAQ